jgi:hypothetical protein
MKKQDVINYFGSATKTAFFLKISEAAVSKWGETIPELRAMQLELKTKGALKHNPDLYLVAA